MIHSVINYLYITIIRYKFDYAHNPYYLVERICDAIFAPQQHF